MVNLIILHSFSLQICVKGLQALKTTKCAIDEHKAYTVLYTLGSERINDIQTPYPQTLPYITVHYIIQTILFAYVHIVYLHCPFLNDLHVLLVYFHMLLIFELLITLGVHVLQNVPQLFLLI